MKRIPARFLTSAALCLLLCACSEQEVYSQLTQQQANEMVAVLRRAGITAEKEGRDGNTFAVIAPRNDFPRAIEVLRDNGYPRDGYDSLGQVFKKDGPMSSALEDHARLMHALSQELANTLSSIDGVVVARVHLSVPEKDPLAEKAPPSAASVFIKHKAGMDLSSQQGPIKALVVNAIPGLSYDNVTVVLMPAAPTPVQAVAPDTRLGGLGASLSWGALAGGLLLVAGAATWLLQHRQAATPAAPLRHHLAQPVSDAVVVSATPATEAKR